MRGYNLRPLHLTDIVLRDNARGRASQLPATHLLARGSSTKQWVSFQKAFDYFRLRVALPRRPHRPRAYTCDKEQRVYERKRPKEKLVHDVPSAFMARSVSETALRNK